MYQFLVRFLKSFVLSYNPPFWIKYYHRMPYYIWAAFRGLLSYYLIVLFSYFQSLGRFWGALYHIIIGLFWGAFFPIILLSLGRFLAPFILLFYYHWACCGEYFQMALSMHLGGIFNWVFIALSMILGGIFNRVFSALSMDVGGYYLWMLGSFSNHCRVGLTGHHQGLFGVVFKWFNRDLSIGYRRDYQML